MSTQSNKQVWSGVFQNKTSVSLLQSEILIESPQSTMMLRKVWITTISGTAILSLQTMLLLMFDMKPPENMLDI